MAILGELKVVTAIAPARLFCVITLACLGWAAGQLSIESSICVVPLVCCRTCCFRLDCAINASAVDAHLRHSQPTARKGNSLRQPQPCARKRRGPGQIGVQQATDRPQEDSQQAKHLPRRKLNGASSAPLLLVACTRLSSAGYVPLGTSLLVPSALLPPLMPSSLPWFASPAPKLLDRIGLVRTLQPGRLRWALPLLPWIVC